MNGARFRDRPRDPSLVVDMVRRRAPDADPNLVSALGVLWADALEAVLDAMTESTQASGRVVWPDEARAEMTFELARLSLFVGESIVKDRLGTRDITAIDVAEEEAFLLSTAGKERTANTGRLFAEHLWIPLYDRFVQKYPLLVAADNSQDSAYRTKKRRTGQSPGVKRNHFLPEFVNRPWADDAGNVLVVRHWVDGRVRADVKPVGTWGMEHFLYPQWLESYFHSVESDAAPAFRHLLAGFPLPPDERRIFTSFLIIQMLRTPTFIARIGLGLRDVSRRERWSYPLDEGSLRRAHETLFTNDNVHAQLYSRLSGRRWSILRAAAHLVFPRLDSGIVIAPAGAAKKASLLFPLSPTACLSVGPDRLKPDDPAIQIPARLTDSEMIRTVIRMVATAVRSIVLPTGTDMALWEQLLSQYMSNGVSEDIARYRSWGRPGKQ
jgi:hypothetical protein